MNPRKKKQDFLENIFQYIDKYPREYYVFGFFLLFFLAIVWQTFSYTVLNHNFYQELADKQQTGKVQIPVTRWTVYASTFSPEGESYTVFANSVDLNDIAIDPQVEGDKQELAKYLTDILYKEMCDYTGKKICYNNLLRFLRKLEIEDFQYKEDFVKDLILERVTRKVLQDKVTSVLLESDITFEQEQEIKSWNISWVYPSEAGLYVNPEELIESEKFAEKYIALLGWKKSEILHAVRKRELRYVPIYNKLSLVVSDEIQTYIREERQAIGQWVVTKEESIGNFIILSPHAQRIYPEKTVGSQIIGFLDNSWKWHYGVEWFFHEDLKWNPGALVWKKDIKGRSIEFDTFKHEDKKALEWIDIYTTIDRNIQRKVEDILEAGVKKYRANKGTVVVMQPKTGKILSLANYPKYDPNNPGEVYDLKKVNYVEYEKPEYDLLGKTVYVEDNENGKKFIYDGKTIYLREAEREEYLDYSKDKYTYRNEFGAGVYKNDAISSLYEPGSIMKSITVAVWIDTGEIRAYDFYNDIWRVVIDGFPISNVDKKCLGYNTFSHALNFSCNIWMVRIVQRIGKALLHKYIYDFGFWDITGIPLSGEVYGKIDPYEKWPQSKLLTSSYGLGISVTPLQMAAAYSVLVNGGVYMKPYIVDHIVKNNGEKISYKPEKLRQVIKPSTSKTMVKLLVDSIDKWVAKNGAVEWYKVWWKTGTSQIAYKWWYEDGVASTYGSFAGFAPAEDPKFVIVVKLERPRTSPYGWSTSAYIFSEIASEILQYYQIPKKIEQ